MPTVITVHGTNATGPEHGNSWWQRGSQFEQHLRDLIQGVDATPITFEPHVWDGANSEKSRRIAGAMLGGRMRCLEDAKEPYCVLGHSHGGSVISHALLQSAAKGMRLNYLSRWLTVGTPFVYLGKSPLLFSKLGIFARSAALSVGAFVILYSLAVVNEALDAFFLIGGRVYLVILIEVSKLSVPAVLLYGILRYSKWRELYMYRRKVLVNAAAWFAHRWTGLWHRDDEAISGLISLNKTEFEIFKDDFAVSALSFFSIFLVPAAILYALSSEYLLSRLCELKESLSFTCYATDSVYGRVDTLVFTVRNWFKFEDSNDVAFPSLVVIPLLLFAACLLLTYAVTFVARAVSLASSRILNRVTSARLYAIALGNDTLGEKARLVREVPHWVACGLTPLPDCVADEISEFSNEAAASSIAKFRRTVGQLAFADSKQDKQTVVANVLSWKELIHTTYFDVPRCRMLVAYAISKARGFQATAAFRNHPDYDLVATWYSAIQPVFPSVAGSIAEAPAPRHPGPPRDRS